MMKGGPHLCLPACLGFLLLGSSAPTQAAHVSDPGEPGPHAVTREEYNFGDTAFTPTDFASLIPAAPVEVIASVHYPTDLVGGPFPLVIFLHGRHATCFEGSAAFLQWPCSPPRQPIPSYQGYDYIADVLASHGYIVVSISANGINARDNSVFDRGMLARAELIQHHLDLWQAFHTTGGIPFGSKFVGNVSLNNVGLMGHSRGGEGVVRHFLFNAAQSVPYGIMAVLPLAPVDFNRPVINNVPLAVPLPYCDGDVADLQGVHLFDDARYNVPGDVAPKHLILVMGANHNFYNTIWTPGLFPAGAGDDWLLFVPGGASDPHCGTVPGNRRLTPEQQRGTGLAYIAGFFRLYLGGESRFTAMLAGDVPPPPSAMTSDIFPSYHAPEHLRQDVNRLLDATNLTINTLGGAVSQIGLTPYDLCGGEPPQPRFCLPGQPNPRQPHTTPSLRAPNRRGLSQLRAGWDAPFASYQNELPAGFGDVSGFRALQFRVSVNFADVRNPASVPQDFRVVMSDGAGNAASVNVSAHSRVLLYPPGAVLRVPKVVLNAARIPLAAFHGVDLSDAGAIQFEFDQTPAGALLIADLAFADEAVGRITGGGSIQGGQRVRHGFELHCKAGRGPNNLQVAWGNGNRFHLETVTRAVCTDDPAIAPNPPQSGFDTYRGGGTGRYNGASGATAEWTFTDAGEPGTGDFARIVVRDAGGNVVLSASGSVQGNHQAHEQ